MAEKKVHEACGREVAHKLNGEPYTHACDARPDDPFETAGQAKREARRAEQAAYDARPKPPVRDMFADPGEKLPPVISARFDSECDTCPKSISEGDEIRSDGMGGWECASHAEEERAEDAPHVHSFTWNAQAGESQCAGCGEPDTAAAKAARVHGAEGQYLSDAPPVAVGIPPEPDPWDDPTPPAGPKLNVSGQPDARYEWRGKQNYGYLVKDPRTGDFLRYRNGKPKGWTRATTFNKSASDSMALNDWGKRNVLIGASLRPDVVAKAHGLTHETGKGKLMSLVAELETAAGAKVSAQQGTDIHELTERWDGGQLARKDVPAMYWDTIALYDSALRAAGLSPVPGLIERTVFVEDFGGIVGTFDRVYLHKASGQYVIGDVKTGKTLAYGMDEIETQEWIYAAGINRYGVYDWNTDTWRTPKHATAVPGHPDNLTVSEEWGVVIHLPVQGPDAGTCKLVRADLQRGKRHAQVCHDVRVDRANKPKPEPWDASLLGAGRKVNWDEEFANVRDTAHAGRLWEAARAAGVTGPELDRLVQLAQQRLRELGV